MSKHLKLIDSLEALERDFSKMGAAEFMVMAEEPGKEGLMSEVEYVFMSLNQAKVLHADVTKTTEEMMEKMREVEHRVKSLKKFGLRFDVESLEDLPIRRPS